MSRVWLVFVQCQMCLCSVRCVCAVSDVFVQCQKCLCSVRCVCAVWDVFVQCEMCLCSVRCVCAVWDVNHDYSARLNPVHKARRTYHWIVGTCGRHVAQIGTSHISLTWLSLTHHWIVAHVSMSHVPHMHESCVTRTRHTWRMHT